ncbi:MAG: hypothetical protein VB050_04005 [Geobacteraceae bacterium]|nr:hypothetical protein [Geobacteraceae bacterium]
MRKATIGMIASIALFGVVLTAHLSIAGQPSPAPVQDQSTLDVSGFGQPLSGENLGGQSGRQAVLSIDQLEKIISNVKMNGYVQDNSISGNSFTGANSVAGNAFSGMNGFATVIQNSGNQVLIQNDLIVNVTTH